MRTRALASAIGLVSLAAFASACAGRTRLGEPDATETVRATLDANTRTVWPGKRVKYWVDVENLSGGAIEVDELSIELTASPAADPATIAIRRTWGYRMPHAVSLAPGRKLTTPLVPEEHQLKSGSGQDSLVQVTSEFAVAQLAPGPYLIRAIVNGSHVSNAYAMEVKPPPVLGAGAVSIAP